MATRIHYNGVDLYNVQTTLFEQRAVRDSSDTDVMYTEFTVAGESIVYLIGNGAGAPSVGVGRISGIGTLVEKIQKVQKAFSEDRKPFMYWVDGEGLFGIGTIRGEDGGVIVGTNYEVPDSNNGPKVTAFKITKFSPKAYRIQFEIKVCVPTCGRDRDANTMYNEAVVSNRWSVSEDTNDNWITTRIIRGRLRLRKAVNSPHFYRYLVVPKLNTGFKRISMNFVAEPNGLDFSYDITDRMIASDAAPAPAIKLSGVHTESIDRSGATTVSDVHVQLTGVPGAERSRLFVLGLNIVNAKVNFMKEDAPGVQSIFESLTLVDHFGDEQASVEIRASIRRVAKPESSGNVTKDGNLGSIIFETLGQPLPPSNSWKDYKNYRATQMPMYTIPSVNYFKCYLQDPCSNHWIPSERDMITDPAATEDSGGNTVIEGDKPKPKEIVEDPVVGDFVNGPIDGEATLEVGEPSYDVPKPDYSTDHQQQGIYTHINVESIYDVDNNTLALPIANSAAGDRDSSVSFVQIGKPTAKRTVKLSFERVNAWPQVIKAQVFKDKSGITHVPLSSTRNIRPPEPQGGGEMLYVIDQEIEFGLNRAPEPHEMASGTLPWTVLQSATIPKAAIVAPNAKNGL